LTPSSAASHHRVVGTAVTGVVPCLWPKAGPMIVASDTYVHSACVLLRTGALTR
jgi:hypothetical protein